MKEKRKNKMEFLNFNYFMESELYVWDLDKELLIEILELWIKQNGMGTEFIERVKKKLKGGTILFHLSE